MLNNTKGLRLLRGWGIPVAASVSLIFSLVDTSLAATVSRQVYVSFDGTLAGGNSYILGPGELDVSGTFRKNGAASIASGVADIPGDSNASSGFLFDSASLGFNLTNTSWVTEAVLVPDVSNSGQPGLYNHLLDVQGDLFYRFNGDTVAPKFTQFGFWDGASEPAATVPDLPTTGYSHVALAWDAGTRTLEAFVDGLSQGSVSTGNAFATPSTNVGYGFFARNGFLDRAFDGKLAGVAFSTFTGALNPGFGDGFDFQLDPTDTADLALKIQVNTISGGVSLVNNTLAAISIQGYDVTSDNVSLDASALGWWSLSDQNLDPVDGGSGPGQTWQEGGNNSSGAILEAFLLGNTTIAPGESISLGKAYDTSVDARDIEFRYRLAGVSGTIDGLVDYDSSNPQVFGDFDDDLDVDGQDFLEWQRALGAMSTLPNDRTPGTVSASDLLEWQTNYGTSLSLSQASKVEIVPEPATEVSLLVALALGCVWGKCKMSAGSHVTQQTRRMA